MTKERIYVEKNAKKSSKNEFIPLIFLVWCSSHTNLIQPLLELLLLRGVTRGKCFTNYLQLYTSSTNHPPSVTNVASMCQIRDKLFTCLTIQLSSFPDTVWQTQHTFPSRSSPHNIKNFSTHRKFFLIKHWHLTGFKDCCTNNCSYIWSHQCLFWNNTENANI